MALLPSCNHFRGCHSSSRCSVGRRYYTGRFIETLDETNTAAWMEEYDGDLEQLSFEPAQFIPIDYGQRVVYLQA